MKASPCTPARSRAHSKSTQGRSALPGFVNDEFETAVLAELRHLRRCEKRLQTMYPRLKSTPQLRGRFVQQLGEMQLRAQRLDAVLNPLGALQFGSLPSSIGNIPVA
ncbi:MAG TPA: hypothetical protein VME17_06155 [Bryobacteraceae bacterium]|nr:hypothetical protein [Bryobacteraceae bacterium]